ncbi:MAG: type II secretion system protein GspD [bacterium]|nr:type II secretion system protein GspD [bacterium]
MTDPNREKVKMAGKSVAWWVLLVAVVLPCVASAQASTKVIGPGDLVYIDVHRRPELSTTTQVDADGNVQLSYVGKVPVSGKSEREAAGTVAQALRRILKNPQVTVSKGLPAIPSAGRTSEMVTEMVALNNSNAESLVTALQGMTSEGGAIGFDPDTNTLILTDTPAAVKNMLNVVERLDTLQSQRTQVRIESKVAEVRVGAMQELGLRWWVQENEYGGGYYPLPGQDIAINGLKAKAASPFNNESIGGLNTQGNSGTSSARRFVNGGQSFDRRLNVPVHVPKTGQMFFGMLNDDLDIGLLLDALEADDQAELLTAPSILTLNHKTSLIKLVDEFPYTEFGTELSGRSTTSVRFMDLGVKMQVTPHVLEGPEGTYVKMELEPEVSFAVGASNGVPIRSVRSFSGTASVLDGQTLAIGGIYRNDLHDVEQRVPFLGKIPVIGLAFKRKEDSRKQTELIVLVTPTVHESPSTATWDRMLDITKASKIVAPAILDPDGAQREPVKE